MKRIVQFGAGNIGRGFLGHLYWQSGYETVFVDIADTIVNELNRKRQYTLKLVGPRRVEDINITHVRAVNAKDINQIAEELCTAEFTATAVGVNVLKNVVPLLIEGIKRRIDRNVASSLNIIICENLLHSGTILKHWFRESIKIDKESFGEQYIETQIGFVESVVSRMIPLVPPEIKITEPTTVMAEDYEFLPVAKPMFRGEIPPVRGMVPYADLQPYEEMKLFIHNLGHSMCGYLGYQKKYEYVWQAIEDKDIRNIIEPAMYESGWALIKKFSIPEEEIKTYISDLLVRFANKRLADTIYRVARDPVRKLGPQDRLIGAAQNVIAQNIKPHNIVKGIVAALAFTHPEDKEAQKIQSLLNSSGKEYVLTTICGLSPTDILYQMILQSTI